MSYGSAFAAFYDRLTGEIDYRRRAQYFDQIIRQHITVTDESILLDLACGTGSLSVALSALGYDVIGVDASADMLSEAVPKDGGARRVLYLCQPIEKLDLYGTVDAAVCALDSVNHITDLGTLEKAFARVALFTVPGGLFVFDANTAYKHRAVLGDNTFVYDLEDVYCVWQNSTDETLKTEIELDFFIPADGRYRRESERFFECAYTSGQLTAALEKAGYELLAIYAADTFEPLGEHDERAVYVARRRA